MTKTALFGAALLAAVISTPPAAASGVDVGVSIGISQPGVYGRIDIGRFPQPQVVLPQPVIIAPPPLPPRGVVIVQPAPPPQPVYLWVPPGHRKDWRKHCGKYDACGVPVYFVRDDWYERKVERRARWKDRERWHDDDRGKGRGHGKGRKDD